VTIVLECIDREGKGVVDLRQTISMFLTAALLTSGCATYSKTSFALRQSLSAGDTDGASRALRGHKKGPDQLLYLLETALISHRNADYVRSNALFEKAERLADRLHTRSATREAASLLTNDAVRAYRGEPFELALINYYRALNYCNLGQPEDALVECRKANRKLARLASLGIGGKGYANDAFIHYLTGLIYEATGEWNDASVSYRAAIEAYGKQSAFLGLAPPSTLTRDLNRVETILDDSSTSLSDEGLMRPGASTGEVVLFSEIGFVPRKTQEEINLPIYRGDVKSAGGQRVRSTAASVAARRYSHGPHAEVDYWLRAAVPVYAKQSSPDRTIRLTGDGVSALSLTVQDVGAIARAVHTDRQNVILTRTVARGLAKYVASRKLKKRNRIVGFLANLFATATEVADTRGWVSLPGKIQIGRLDLRPGVHSIHLEVIDAQGKVLENTVIESVEVRAGKRTFLSHRTYI
jgi:uncharacterized protein